MGRVYRAEDVVLGRSVAVKVVKPAGDVSNVPDRVRNEVKLLAAAQHPSLVTLLDAHIDDPNSSYLVMEYVAGPSLARRLRGGPLTELEAATLAAHLASGVEALHRAGVVHRDITPSNVLLAPSALSRVPFRAKLADFGVAFLLDSTRLTTPGMVVGTAAYLAPEQVRGDAAATPADIYALGLVLLEALTGERAYPHASGVGAIMARLVEPPNIPDAVGPVWRRLLTRMIAIDPAERPAAREVVEIATALCKTARTSPVVTADAAVVPVPVTSLPTQPLALPAPDVAAPLTTRVAPGSGERARLRRSRVRGLRRRRALIMVGSAALVAALAVPTGWWATAWPSDEPGMIATEPDLTPADSLIPADSLTPADSPVPPDEPVAVTEGADDIVPASSSGAASDSAVPESAETDDFERDAAKEQAKAVRDAAKKQDKAERDAGNKKEKSERDAGKKKDNGAREEKRDR